MVKPHVNFWVDVTVGTAFAVAAVSGLVFLLPTDGGTASEVLGLSYRLWDQIHLWSSLAAITGVVVHLVLHAKWIGVTARRVLQTGHTAGRRTTPDGGVSRRRFLSLGGVALASFVAGGISGALALSMGKAGPGSGSESPTAVASPLAVDLPPMEVADGDAAPAATAQPVVLSIAEAATPTVVAGAVATATPTATATVEMCVTCPRGLVNDPYPGHCRLYVDRNGNGLCDRSEPVPCS